MTQRDRLAFGGVTELAPRPAAVHEAPSRRVPVAFGSWEDIYIAAPAALRHELLSLAREQGLLHGHQCPPPVPANGHGNDAALLTDSGLQALLEGDVSGLATVHPGPVDFCDADLDVVQRAAVTGALATPDVFLLQGLPGTGKSRVVAEIVTQSALRGERILLAAPSPAPLDRILELVGQRDALCPIRCLADDELPESLPAASRALTFAERLRHLGEQPLLHARREQASAEQRCQRRRLDEAVLDRLAELVQRRQALEGRGETLRQAKARIPEDVEHELLAGEAPFAIDMSHAVAAQQELLAGLAAAWKDNAGRTTQRRGELADLQPALETVRRLAECKAQGRWWSLAWWQATLRGHVADELSSLQSRVRQLQSDLETLDGERRRLEHDRAHAEDAFEADQARRIRAEIARRQALHYEALAALAQEQVALQEQWHACCGELLDDTPRPEEGDALGRTRDFWTAQLLEDEELAAFARQWVGCLEEGARTLADRLRRCANLVAATSASLAVDPHFGNAAPAATFDLLVLQDADQVTRSEFLHLARRARRWVLVGEIEREASTHGALRPGFFRDLWHLLHGEPRLASNWIQENNRLCCQLRTVPPEQRPRLESERVADFPEVELRILNLPHGQTALAEVLFPASMSLAQAKAYLFQELQELPVSATAPSVRWSEEDDQMVLHLGADVPADSVRVALEPGVREVLWRSSTPANARGTIVPRSPETVVPRAPEATIQWHTSRLEFDRQMGWQRPRALAWVEKHLGLRDLGRTARLDVPHRMQPELAGFLSELLFAGAYGNHARGPLNGQNGQSPPIEFIGVGQEPAEGRQAKRGPQRSRVSKGGAGLELDLTDQRHRDRLPSELRPHLPEHGFVNYLEAQAVVRVLERLAATPTTRTLLTPDAGAAVIALYPAQAALIRRLVQQSTTLASCGFDIVIDVPAAFQQREFPLVLVSLTRSHAHRAVAFGAGPRFLSLALTRARSKLILLGDPGTLVRRTQWTGAVDHLDQAESAREHDIIARIVAYLEGRGPCQQAFHLRSGGGS